MRVLLWLVVIVGCATTAHLDRVPMRLSPNHQLLVPVIINGHAFTFQLDTGASDSVITLATWRRLGLPHGQHAQSAGAGGTIDGETVMLADVRVGERDLHQLLVAVLDLGGEVDGVLGQDVLGRYIAELDIPRQHLVLHDPTSTAWRSSDLVTLPYRVTTGGLIELDVLLEGRALPAILDSGAGASIANSHAASGGVATSAAAMGADGKELAMTSLANQHVVVGEVAFAASTLYISDLPVFEEFGLANAPAMILGIDLLAAHRLVIDPGGKRVYVSR